jgi:PilX N-terminal
MGARYRSADIGRAPDQVIAVRQKPRLNLWDRSHGREERGVALVITLIVLALFSALGLALVLTSATERLTGANYADSVDSLDAAEAALELAARELAGIDDWNAVLSGSRQSRLTDGAPSGLRSLPPLSIDLTALTSQLTCGSRSCTDAAIRTSTAERPWGSNNARWQPFVYGPLAAFTDVPDVFRGAYVVVWIGDDARERDGDPLVDGGAGQEGRNVVRARAEAFVRGGSRRAIEADFVRPCEIVGGTIACRSGIHVQSWRVSSGAIP